MIEGMAQLHMTEAEVAATCTPCWRRSGKAPKSSSSATRNRWPSSARLLRRAHDLRVRCFRGSPRKGNRPRAGARSGLRGRHGGDHPEPHALEPARVGIILDSGVLIAGERRGHTVRQILEHFKTSYGEIEIGLSVVTIVELTQGIQRAGTEERRERRQAFVDELIRDVPVHPVTIETDRLAGRIKGDQAAQGVSIASKI